MLTKNSSRLRLCTWTPATSYEGLAQEIPLRLQDDEDFVDAWLKKGLPLSFRAWHDDRNKILLAVEHGASFRVRESAFCLASDDLLGDAGFVGEAMIFEPCLFQYASEALRNGNDDLAIWALGDMAFVRACCERIRAINTTPLARRLPTILTTERIVDLIRQAERELELHAAFVNLFLAAVSAHQNNLFLGNLKDSENVFVKSVGEYVGIPLGHRLGHLRNAVATFEQHILEVGEWVWRRSMNLTRTRNR